MDARIAFWSILAALLLLVVVFDLKYDLLRDISSADKRPYSFARVQLAWWSVIVLSSFFATMFKFNVPTLTPSALVLLGISSATTAVARVIDLSDINNPGIARSQDGGGAGFILDILSDAGGVSIHRFQAVVLNAAFGIWFVVKVHANLSGSPIDAEAVLPVISQNVLILLGLSSGTYAALKTTENKTAPTKPDADSQPYTVPDEALGNTTSAQG